MVSRERWEQVGTAAPSSDTSAMLAMVGTAADNLAHSVADLDDRQAAAPSDCPAGPGVTCSATSRATRTRW